MRFDAPRHVLIETVLRCKQAGLVTASIGGGVFKLIHRPYLRIEWKTEINVGKVEDLADRFGQYLSVPLSPMGIAAQRVLMIVYDKEIERSMRERCDEFETRAVTAGRHWKRFDCTRLFAEWMASLDYCEAYFNEPEHLATKIEGEFKKLVVQKLRDAMKGSDAHSVIAMTGHGEPLRTCPAFLKSFGIWKRTWGSLAVFFPARRWKQLSLRLTRDG
ncbi:MAG: hypothetical protein IPN90_13755 [Elusimicrobia bacterium]|nr:hypothetical protein [Elusimicrobiota bacterium]